MTDGKGAFAAPAEDNSDHFAVHVDREKRCLHIAMRGHWTDAIFDDYAATLRAAETIMRTLPAPTHTLVDSRSFEMQSPMLAARFPALIAELSLGESRRVALVTQSPLGRMQARPTGELVNARYFRAMENAADWLFSDEA